MQINIKVSAWPDQPSSGSRVAEPHRFTVAQLFCDPLGFSEVLGFSELLGFSDASDPKVPCFSSSVGTYFGGAWLFCS
jgi:hypothetical protein